MHANTLIELAMQHVERKSIRALAERMGISHTKVSEWKNGTKPVPEERIVQLAKIAGQEPGPWLLLVKSEQEGGELGRIWAKLGKQLAATAAALMILLTFPTAKAGISLANQAVTKSEFGYSVYYVIAAMVAVGTILAGFPLHPSKDCHLCVTASSPAAGPASRFVTTSSLPRKTASSAQRTCDT